MSDNDLSHPITDLLGPTYTLVVPTGFSDVVSDPASYLQNGTRPASPPDVSTTVNLSGTSFIGLTGNGTIGLLHVTGNGEFSTGTLFLPGPMGAGAGLAVDNGGFIDVVTGQVIANVVAIGQTSAGELDLRFGAVLNTARIDIGGFGTLDISGGTLNGPLVINGGTLQSKFFSGTDTITSSATLGTAGATIGVGSLATLVATGTIGGAGGLTILGALALTNAANSFTGGVTLSGGTLDLQTVGAAGSNAITFAPGATSVLQFEATPTQTIAGFALGDTIIDKNPLAFAFLQSGIVVAAGADSLTRLPAAPPGPSQTTLALAGLGPESLFVESAGTAGGAAYRLLATTSRILTATGSSGPFAAAASWLEGGTAAATGPDAATAAAFLNGAETLTGGGTAGELVDIGAAVDFANGTFALSGLTSGGANPIALDLESGQFTFDAGAVVNAAGARAIINNAVLAFINGASLATDGVILGANGALQIDAQSSVTTDVALTGGTIQALGTGNSVLAAGLSIGANGGLLSGGTGTLVLAGPVIRLSIPLSEVSQPLQVGPGTVVFQNPSLAITGGLSIIGTAVLDTSNVTGIISFEPVPVTSQPELVIDATGSLGALITSLAINDVIDLRQVAHGTVSLAGAPGTVGVTIAGTGGTVVFVDPDLDPSGDLFVAEADGRGGTQIRLVAESSRILTLQRPAIGTTTFGPSVSWTQNGTTTTTQPDSSTTAILGTPGQDLVSGTLRASGFVVDNSDQVTLQSGSIDAAFSFNNPVDADAGVRINQGGGLTIASGGTLDASRQGSFTFYPPEDVAIGYDGAGTLAVVHGGSVESSALVAGSNGLIELDASSGIGSASITLGGGTLAAIGGGTVTVSNVGIVNAIGTLVTDGTTTLDVQSINPSSAAVDIAGHVLYSGAAATAIDALIAPSSTFEVSGSTNLDGLVANFLPGGGEILRLDGQPTAALTTLIGFQPGDTIDLPNLAPTAIAAVTSSFSNLGTDNIVLTTATGRVLNLSFQGTNDLDAAIVVTPDGAGGSAIGIARGTSPVLAFVPTGTTASVLGQVGAWQTISSSGSATASTALPDATTIAVFDASSGTLGSNGIVAPSGIATVTGALTVAALIENATTKLVVSAGSVTLTGSTGVPIPVLQDPTSLTLDASTVQARGTVAIGGRLTVVNRSTLAASAITGTNVRAARILSLGVGSTLNAGLNLNGLSVFVASTDSPVFDAFNQALVDDAFGTSGNAGTIEHLTQPILLSTGPYTVPRSGLFVFPGVTLSVDGTVQGAAPGAAQPLQIGFGTVALTNATNSFGNGLDLFGATAEITTNGAAGRGDISFDVSIAHALLGASAPAIVRAADLYAGAVLRIDRGVTLTNRIANFGPGQLIDIAGLSPAGAVVGVAASGTNTNVTITNAASQSVTLTLSGTFATPPLFDTRSDGAGGTDLVYVASGPTILVAAPLSGLDSLALSGGWTRGGAATSSVPDATTDAVFDAGGSQTVSGAGSAGEVIISNGASVTFASASNQISGLTDAEVANLGLRVDTSANVTITSSSTLNLGTSDALIGDGTPGSVLVDRGTIVADAVVVGAMGTLAVTASGSIASAVVLTGGTLASGILGAATITNAVTIGNEITPANLIGGQNGALVLTGGLLSVPGQAETGPLVAGGTVVLATGTASGSGSPAASGLSIGAGVLDLATQASVLKGFGFLAGGHGTLRVDAAALTATPVGGHTLFNLTVGGVAGGPSALITGFSRDGAIDLASFVAVGTSAVVAGGSVVLSDATGDQLALVFSDFTAGAVGLGSNGHGGTNIVTTVACFLAGTRLLTRRGEVPVETLREGDGVYSPLRRRFVPLVWIGHRQIDLARHPSPAQARPVRIRADAFGTGVPHRDLLVSPEHMILVDDRLVPARALVNFRSIVWATDIAIPHYVHVELDRHDILLAEGLAAESWLDTGNRSMFANVPMPDLHADFTPGADFAARACRPVITDPVQLELCRQHVRTLTRNADEPKLAGRAAV